MIYRSDLPVLVENEILKMTRENGVPDTVYTLIANSKNFAFTRLEDDENALISFMSSCDALRYIEYIPHECGSGWQVMPLDIMDLADLACETFDNHLMVAVFSGLFELHCLLNLNKSKEKNSKTTRKT